MLHVARSNPTDGTRMVAALASRELAGAAVNRKRVQRLMRRNTTGSRRVGALPLRRAPAHVVAELGVADYIGDAPAGESEPASRCGVDAYALGRVLRLLRGNGVLERVNAGFATTR